MPYHVEAGVHLGEKLILIPNYPTLLWPQLCHSHKPEIPSKTQPTKIKRKKKKPEVQHWKKKKKKPARQHLHHFSPMETAAKSISPGSMDLLWKKVLTTDECFAPIPVMEETRLLIRPFHYW